MPFLANTLTQRMHKGINTTCDEGQTLIPTNGGVFDAVPLLEVGKRAGPAADDPRAGVGIGNEGDPMFTLQAGAQHGVAMVAHALRGEGFDASEDGTGRGTPLIPIDMRQASRGATMTNNRPEGSSGGAPGTGIGEDGDPSPTISTSHTPAIAFAENSRSEVRLEGGDGDRTGALTSGGGKPGQGVPMVFESRYARNGRGAPDEVCPPLKAQSGETGKGDAAPLTITPAMQVRRLTPRECERLQGFPDNYTLIPHRGKEAADGPRYKALCNSWAVPVVRWIGVRIEAVDAIAQGAPT